MTYIILLVLIGLSEKNETGSWIISPMLILVKSFPHNWNGKLQVTTPHLVVLNYRSDGYGYTHLKSTAHLVALLLSYENINNFLSNRKQNIMVCVFAYLKKKWP